MLTYRYWISGFTGVMETEETYCVDVNFINEDLSETLILNDEL